ncbi:MAG: hypothetical protein ACJASV_000557 [Pseudorhodobacter sp.]|jgi:hypothetical protein
MAGDKCAAINITLKGSPKTVLEEVKKAAKSDAEITGDENSGKIKVKKVDVTGTYSVKGQKLTINMVDNTMWVDCKTINEKLSAYFKGK